MPEKPTHRDEEEDVLSSGSESESDSEENEDTVRFHHLKIFRIYCS
jgi:hypothetical protein